MRVEDIMISDYGDLRSRVGQLTIEVENDLLKANRVQEIRKNILKNWKWIKYITHSDALYRSRRILVRLGEKNMPKLLELMNGVSRCQVLISELQEYYDKEIEEKLESHGIDPDIGLAAVFSLQSKFDDKDIDTK